MAVRENNAFTAYCDACHATVAFASGSKESLVSNVLANHAYYFAEDDTVFCATCMKIYRSVALAIIPEAFEGKDGSACGLRE